MVHSVDFNDVECFVTMKGLSNIPPLTIRRGGVLLNRYMMGDCERYLWRDLKRTSSS